MMDNVSGTDEFGILNGKNFRCVGKTSDSVGRHLRYLVRRDNAGGLKGGTNSNAESSAMLENATRGRGT